MLTLDYACLSDPGRKRRNNEDSAVTDESLGLALIADGMGGYNAGEVASGMATSFICTELGRWLAQASQRASDLEVRRAMDICVDNANRAIFNAANANPQYAGMGTTLVMMLVVGQHAVMGHVGDSRLYMLRGGSLHQLSEDHSYVTEMIKRGKMTREEAKRSPYNNVITRAIGIQPSVQVDTLMFDVLPRDTYLLCSDGLNNVVANSEIHEALKGEDSISKLISLTYERGAPDNVTVLIAEIGDGDTPTQFLGAAK